MAHGRFADPGRCRHRPRAPLSRIARLGRGGACPVDHDRMPSARGDASKGLRHPGGTPVNSTRKQMDVSSSAPAVGATPGRAVVQVQFILKFPGRAPSRAARSTSCSGGWESDRSSRPAEAPRDSSKIDWAGAEAGAKMSVGPQCGRMACPNAAPIDINAVPPGQQMWRSNRRASLGLSKSPGGEGRHCAPIRHLPVRNRSERGATTSSSSFDGGGQLAAGRAELSSRTTLPAE